jgi:hypothetical protein
MDACFCVDSGSFAPQNTQAEWRVLPPAPSPDKQRHMDVYPSRNVDIRSLRVPTPHNNKLNACGDRLRSAGAFLD